MWHLNHYNTRIYVYTIRRVSLQIYTRSDEIHFRENGDNDNISNQV